MPMIKNTFIRVESGLRLGFGSYREILKRDIHVSSSLCANRIDSEIISLTSRPFGQDSSSETNVKTETNRLSKTLKKFWTYVDTVYNEDASRFEIQLDGKPIKTPLGFPMTLPENKSSLAHLVGHEWANLPDLRIKMNSLPLTSIVARSVDLERANSSEEGNEELVTKVGSVDDIRINLLRYLDTDTCLIYATRDECDGKLRKRQDELYIPLKEEFNSYFTSYAAKKGSLLPSENYKVELQSLDCETDGLRGNRQSITTQNIVLSWMRDLSIYELVALEKAVLSSKSFLCGAILLRSNCSDIQRMTEFFQLNRSPNDHYSRSIYEVVELGNLETIFQTTEWGEVEDTHDVDKEDWLRNLSSAALLAY